VWYVASVAKTENRFSYMNGISVPVLSDGKGILPIYMVFIYMGIYMGVNYPSIL